MTRVCSACQKPAAGPTAGPAAGTGQFCIDCGKPMVDVSEELTSYGSLRTSEGQEEDNDEPILAALVAQATSLGDQPTLDPGPEESAVDSDGDEAQVIDPTHADQVSGGLLDSSSGASNTQASAPTSNVSVKRRARKPVELDPTLDYLIELLPQGRIRPWKLNRPFYTVGRSGAKIALKDPRVSNRHLALAKIGPDWVVINRSDRRMRINGWELRQATLQHGDVIRIGTTWLAFLAASKRKAESPLRPFHSATPKNPQTNRPSIPKGSATLDSIDDDEEETCLLSLRHAGRQVATSQGRAILIGSADRCYLRVKGEGISPVHCLVAWMPEGPTLFDFGRGTLLEGRPIKSCVVQHQQRITIGSVTLDVHIAGTPTSPAAERLRDLRSLPRSLSMTAIYGPYCGSTVELQGNEPVVIGRKSGVELSLDAEQQLSRRHVAICLDRQSLSLASGPQVALKDLDSANGTLLNRKLVQSEANATLGDVIQFGPVNQVSSTALFLHLPLYLDSWA